MRRNYTRTYHIIFDAFGVHPKLLDDERFMTDILLELPPLMGMKILAGPSLVRDYSKKKPGVTGFAIVDFSHISLHSFVKTREVFIDLFSCKPFEYEKARKYLLRRLKVKPHQVETLEVKYPWEQ